MIREIANKFFFLRVNADDGKPRRDELMAGFFYLVELCVAIRVGRTDETFAVPKECYFVFFSKRRMVFLAAP